MTIFTEPKSEELRCKFCWPNGTCDKVALRFEWCGLARLANMVEGKPFQ